MRIKALFAAALLAGASTAAAAASQPTAPRQQKPPSAGEIVKAAPAADWIAIAPADLLVMDLAPDAAGKPRRVIIQLLPAPFSQGWIGNMKKLALAHWWDNGAVYRVQDNWVAQFGDPDEDTPKAKPLPAGLAVVPEAEYEVHDANRIGQIARQQAANSPILASISDPYASNHLFWRGFPFAHSGDDKAIWPTHCYASVGVGRNNSPDTGTGAELYAVIGTPPRQLDRNIAVVGRVVEGIEHLSSLPRAPGNGMYNDKARNVPILSIRLASELPPADQPRLQYLSTESASFAAYVSARVNRRDAFYIYAAGSADICNIPVPIRHAP